MKRNRKPKKRAEKGQAIIEFALLFTLLVLLLMGVFGFGIILTTQITLVSASKAATRAATLQNMRTIYCTPSGAGGHHNDPIYAAAIQPLTGLNTDNVAAIVIFEADSDGAIIVDNQDVLDADGNLLVSSFPNGERCPGAVGEDKFIGVEIRYNQEVPVPIFNWITGDVVVLPAKTIMRLE